MSKFSVCLRPWWIVRVRVFKQKNKIKTKERLPSLNAALRNASIPVDVNIHPAVERVVESCRSPAELALSPPTSLDHDP